VLLAEALKVTKRVCIEEDTVLTDSDLGICLGD